MRWTQAFVFALMFKNIHATCYSKKNYPALDTADENWGWDVPDTLNCQDATGEINRLVHYSMSCSASCTGTGGSNWYNGKWTDRCCKSCTSPYGPIDAWACQATCSDFSSITCSDSLKKFDVNKVCNEGSCNEATCCVPLTKCSEVTCDASAGFNRLDDSTACPAEGCTPAQCCQATCNDFSSSITCSELFTRLDGNKVCNEGSCNEATCCVPLTKCSEVTCAAGFNRLDDSTVCPVEGCTPAQCCATTCLDYWSDHIENYGIGQVCPNPQSPKLNNTKECFENGIEFELNTCEHDRLATCCVPLTKCSEITTCPSGMFLQYKRLDDSTACPAEGCTTAQCCGVTCGEWMQDGMGCNSGVVNNTQTCSAPDMSKSTWDERIKHTGACKDETCCVSKVNKCSEVACWTVDGYYNLDDSTACPPEGCTPAQCCERTCGDWSRWRDCNSGVVNNTQTCSGPDMSKSTWDESIQHTGACKDETCCVSKVNKCSEVVCNADYYHLDDSTACPSEGCTPAQCCRPTCAADSQFPSSVGTHLCSQAYSILKSNPDTIQCAGAQCVMEECCRPSCAGWHSSYSAGFDACPSSTHTYNSTKVYTLLSLGWDGMTVDNPTTIQECCDFNGNCAAIKNQFNQLKSIYDNNCPCA